MLVFQVHPTIVLPGTLKNTKNKEKWNKKSKQNQMKSICIYHSWYITWRKLGHLCLIKTNIHAKQI